MKRKKEHMEIVKKYTQASQAPTPGAHAFKGCVCVFVRVFYASGKAPWDNWTQSQRMFVLRWDAGIKMIIWVY